MRTSSKESLFEKMLTSHFGMAFSAHTYDQVWSLVTHQDGKVRLAVPRLAEANAARARLLTARWPVGQTKSPFDDNKRIL